MTQGRGERRQTPRRQEEDRAKIFTIGAAYGFVAGVFAMALIVWPFGDVVGRRRAPLLAEKAPAGIEGPAVDKAAAESPIIQTPPAAATSGNGAEVASPAIAPS